MKVFKYSNVLNVECSELNIREVLRLPSCNSYLMLQVTFYCLPFGGPNGSYDLTLSHIFAYLTYGLASNPLLFLCRKNSFVEFFSAIRVIVSRPYTFSQLTFLEH